VTGGVHNLHFAGAKSRRGESPRGCTKRTNLGVAPCHRAKPNHLREARWENEEQERRPGQNEPYGRNSDEGALTSQLGGENKHAIKSGPLMKKKKKTRGKAL